MDADEQEQETDDPAFEAIGLTLERAVRFGDREVCLRSLSLRLDRGGALALVGERGSGISVLGQLLAGGEPRGIRILQGRLGLFGEDVSRFSRRRRRARCRRRVAYLGENPRATLRPDATVSDQLREFVQARSLPRKRGAREALGEALFGTGVVEPGPLLAKAIASLDPLELSRVALARAFLAEPDLLVVDHGGIGLDPSREELWLENVFQAKTERGCDLVFACGGFRGAAALCDRAAVFFEGGLLEEGTPREIAREPRFEYTRDLVQSSPRVSGYPRELPVPSREAIAEAEEAIHGAPVSVGDPEEAEEETGY